MTYSIQIILKIKIFCIKIAWVSHFTKTVTSKASKSLVFVFFLQKITILIQKQILTSFTPKSIKPHLHLIRFLRSLFFTILTILRLFSKISSTNTGCWDSSHPQWASLTFYFFLSFRKYIKIPWIILPRHDPITAPAMVIPSIST